MSGLKKTDTQIVYLFENDMSFVIGETAIKYEKYTKRFSS